MSKKRQKTQKIHKINPCNRVCVTCSGALLDDCGVLCKRGRGRITYEFARNNRCSNYHEYSELARSLQRRHKKFYEN